MLDTSKPGRGCFMAQGLYLKANGELPCWDDVGEARILRVLDPDKLARGDELALSGFDELVRIRRAFRAGRVPNPGLCERCAVKTAGLPVSELHPRTLQVLHVEPSYLCQLSCPQCITPKLRKGLKGPPYHLTPEMYDGFLRQLRIEGVDDIRLVVLEGRGDPLVSPHLRDIIALTKRHYPGANTCVTTHGSYPVRPWIIDSGLDMIRFSVDGAFQENYQKYRIGGKLGLVFDFMRYIRDTPRTDGSFLYVEWKYILFEWNDSDEELRHAAALADELNVKLRFCRTHTPGRSLRYATAAALGDMIARLAPHASPDLTFQLKDGADIAEVEAVRFDRIRDLLRTAEAGLDACRETEACRAILGVLAIDAGIPIDSQPTYVVITGLLAEMADRLTVPQAACGLAAVMQRIGADALVSPLLERYLVLAPHAPDRGHVRRTLDLRRMMAAQGAGDADRAAGIAIRLLTASPTVPDPLLGFLGQALGCGDAATIEAMANLYLARGHRPAAALLFERFVALVPGEGSRGRVMEMVRQLRQA